MSDSSSFRILEWWAGLGRLGRSGISLLLLVLAALLWLIYPDGWPWMVCLSLGVLLLGVGLSLD